MRGRIVRLQQARRDVATMHHQLWLWQASACRLYHHLGGGEKALRSGEKGGGQEGDGAAAESRRSEMRAPAPVNVAAEVMIARAACIGMAAGQARWAARQIEERHFYPERKR